VKAYSVAVVAAVGLLVGVSSAGAAAPKLDVYEGTIESVQLEQIVGLGVDRHELEVEAVEGDDAKDLVRVETILSAAQATALRRDGVDLELKQVDGQSVAERATILGEDGFEVFRRYAGPGGLLQDFRRTARENRRLTKLVTIGQTLNGQDIVALKISRDARKMRDGRKPSVLYLGAQHAREWITPEMIRRLKDEILRRYKQGNPRVRRLLKHNELWFVPVANPDGYDFTFEEGQRLWRKNLRDNDGDGEITGNDGVDLNRNFDYRWGYDNEGSSPDFPSETYRGASGNSEPETRALDRFMRRVGFEFFVNYHSAAELLLYGIGWQVATPSPDDVIYEAMAGDDADPAVPGYDPDISAELYTTNGDTDTYMQARYGTLGFTPEMSTCEAASDVDPDDEWEAEDCGSGFEFPDDEDLVQQEFEKNIPFALSVAESADDPDDPESVVGRTAENFRVDSFDVSYGSPQTVAVVAKRALRRVKLNYRIGDGKLRKVDVRRWRGGERYGDENDDYYHELRGIVRGADEGDRVRVFFSGYEPRERKRGKGKKKGKGKKRYVESERFGYVVESSSDADVLVIANEDYTGVNPDYPDDVTAPKYADAYVQAIEAGGASADVWDVDAQGVPHDLGVLSHYDAVLWYLGDNRITQDPEDELIQTPFGELEDIGVAERQQYLTMSVRDYLNEGGKLVHAGETAQYSGLPGISDVVGGLYYALNGDETAECVVETQAGFFEDCLILADDFRQYYLGAFTRIDLADPEGVTGIAEPIAGFEGDLGGPVVEGDNPLDEAGVFQPTSEVLPEDEFPQFASHAAAEYPFEGGPYSPVEGARYAGAVHADNSYTRLTKTVDLTSVAAADNPQLQFQLSLNSETGYDHVLIEARTPGGDDWTTLPDLNGGTSSDVPSECEVGFLLELHPFLEHYLTGGNPCTNTGTSGAWNSFTGSTDGWIEAAADLSAYAGEEVELSITYVTDPAGGGVGAFVDDTSVVAGGETLEADGFEADPSTWAVTGSPEGSPPTTAEWEFGEQLVNFYAATATEDTLLLGFGLEQLATDEERAALVEQALGGLSD
jgi:Zinc carboxypeptidase/Immune inhibitor A peptidase M6